MVLLDTPKPQPLALVDHPQAFIEVSNEREDRREKLLRNLDGLRSAKADRHANDNEKSRLFLLIGFVISMGLALLAFEWKFYDPKELISLGAIQSDFNEILDIPLTEQAPPPPPQNMAVPNLVAVADEVLVSEIDLKIDVEITEGELLKDVVYEEVLFEPEAEKVEEIFDIVESPATPVGGMQAFYEYVAANLKYPASALRLGVSGKVFVQFVIEKDGSITDVKVLKGIEDACDAEAIRVVKSAPKWEPGRQRGRAVRVYQRLPIVFVFRED